MDIKGELGFYTDEEQIAIGRGESEPLANIEHGDLYTKFHDHRRQLDVQRSSDDELTPDFNAMLLYEGKISRHNKLIIDGVAKQLLDWQVGQPSADPRRR